MSRLDWITPLAMPSPFDSDAAARELLERLRWPEGPACPRCGSSGAAVFEIGGEKRSHRAGLHQCKPCRQQFSVTVGTPLERQRIPLSTWMVAAREFSADDNGRAPNARGGDNLVPLIELQMRVGVSYKTILRMRDIIERAAKGYRGYKKGFGAWPRSFMKHKSSPRLRGYQRVKQKLLEEGKHPSQHTVRASGVLADTVSASRRERPAMERTEALLRILLVPPKKVQGKRHT